MGPSSNVPTEMLDTETIEIAVGIEKLVDSHQLPGYNGCYKDCYSYVALGI
jgi:hypothetical protein